MNSSMGSSMEWVSLLVALLLLLIAANGAPIVTRQFMGQRWANPVDGGCRDRNGLPLLGESKTWRGLLAAVLTTAILAAILELGFWFGLVFGVLAMLGDLVSSYVKRRRGLPASARANGLDQFPEALLPLLLAHFWLGIGWGLVIAVAGIFYLLVTYLSPMLFRMGIRKRPH